MDPPQIEQETGWPACLTDTAGHLSLQRYDRRGGDNGGRREQMKQSEKKREIPSKRKTTQDKEISRG